MKGGAVAEHTPLALARLAADHMAEKGIENARLDAELLLAHVLGVSRLDLYLQYDRPLSAEEVDRYRALLRRRLRREPLQYILGEAPFRELVLEVDPRVLIPRPETEVLVDVVLRWARDRGVSGLTAVDIGTGSGAIALSLACEGPFERVVATDVSADALALAGQNVRRHGLDGRVELRHGALWEALGEDERFDVVVSNPPYIADAERGELEPEVREWEPATALFAPGGGMAVIDALIDGAAAHLRPAGLLALEVGAGQAQAAAERIERAGVYASPRVIHDLAGRERIVAATAETIV